MIFVLVSTAETKTSLKFKVTYDQLLADFYGEGLDSSGDPFTPYVLPDLESNQKMKEDLLENTIPELVDSRVFDLATILKQSGVSFSVNEYCIFIESKKLIIARVTEENWDLIEAIISNLDGDVLDVLKVSFRVYRGEKEFVKIAVYTHSGDTFVASREGIKLEALVQCDDEKKRYAVNYRINFKGQEVEALRSVVVNSEEPLASWSSDDKQLFSITVKVEKVEEKPVPVDKEIKKVVDTYDQRRR